MSTPSTFSSAVPPAAAAASAAAAAGSSFARMTLANASSLVPAYL
ncbi:hypothetical protein AB0D11_17835 [Streptomyces monashensis]